MAHPFGRESVRNRDRDRGDRPHLIGAADKCRAGRRDPVPERFPDNELFEPVMEHLAPVLRIQGTIRLWDRIPDLFKTPDQFLIRVPGIQKILQGPEAACPKDDFQ